ncbi:MAG: hypothetical protein HRT71_04800 [Flavobacteriales bacterium]|nr:hypothetical protein [Flavobacteriales bacterium]
MNNQLTKVSRCAALLICWVLSSHTVYADHGSGGAVSVSLNSSNSALTLKKGQWLIQSLSEFRTYKSFSSSDLIGIGMGDYTIVEKQRLMFGALNVTYGLMNRFSLSVQQAYYMSVVDIIGDNSSKTFSKGSWLLGDLTILNNFQFYQNNKKGIGLSAMFGAELSLSSSRGGEVGSLMVSSSNSTDPIMGVMFKKKWATATLNAGVMYKLTTTSKSGMDYGDFLGGEISFLKHFGRELADSTNSKKINWNFSASVEGELLQSQKYNNSEILHTGYYQAIAGAGVMISVNKKISIPVSLKIPVYRNVSGYQNTMRGGLKIAINILI